MLRKKGVSLPITALVILTLAIIVLLAAVVLFYEGWDDEKIDSTQGEIEDKFGDWMNGNSLNENYFTASNEMRIKTLKIPLIDRANGRVKCVLTRSFRTYSSSRTFM